MKALILAAAIGSRLKQITNNKPKTLINVKNKPMLGYILDSLLKNKIKDIVICTGFKSSQIVNFCKNNYPSINFNFVKNKNFKNTNNMFSLFLAKKQLNDNIILMNADLIFDEKIIALLLESNYKNCLALRSEGCIADEEIKVTLAKDKSIKEISKTIDPKLAIGESIGIEKFSAVILRAVQKVESLENPLDNLGLLRFDAGEIESIFDINEIERIFLNFSDPWPKDRWAKRRLTYIDFLNKYKNILKKDGLLRVKTDNDQLYAFTLEEIEKSTFTKTKESTNLHFSEFIKDNIMTEYEARFVKEGKNINFIEVNNNK
jgi:tRNA (guanine-N(7)-)-methyltransferase